MKVTYSVFSSYDGNDLADLDLQIKNALAIYQQFVDEYNSGMMNGSSSYAKRVRLPRVNAATAVLDTLNAQKKAMLSDIGQIQGIDLVNTTTDLAQTEPENEIPWTTIGLVIGALVVIVIIVKLV
ncbi:MAG: hypothetical protein Q8R96_11720 [Bacteroidota bacterium]|nr:hypothetical protein [Bacteroidota bacterium]